jgi:hypothetical protein
LVCLYGKRIRLQAYTHTTTAYLEGVHFYSIARGGSALATSLGGISRDALAVAGAALAGHEDHEVGVVDHAFEKEKETTTCQLSKHAPWVRKIFCLDWQSNDVVRLKKTDGK